MLIVGPITCGKTDLRQGVIKTRALGNLCQFAVIFKIPACALFNVTDNQSAGNIRYPIGKLNRLMLDCWLIIHSLAGAGLFNRTTIATDSFSKGPVFTGALLFLGIRR